MMKLPRSIAVFFASVPLLLAYMPARGWAAENQAERLWRNGPNLLVNGNFQTAAGWHITEPIRDRDSTLDFADALPTFGDVVIYRQPLGNGRWQNMLAMALNGRQLRQRSGVCRSDDIRVVPDMIYRLEFRCRSAGPRPTVIVRGMATVRNENGQPALREVRQWRFVSTDPARDQWNTIRQEFTTEDSAMPVRVLQIDLGGEGSGGYLFFDRLILKAIGRPEPKAAAAPPAVAAPTTRPATPPATRPG